MKKVIVIIWVFVSHICIAQNLVPNPSFEETIACPSSTGEIEKCYGWIHVLNTPDYYNACSSYPVGVPSNFFGEQTAFDGNAYMGLYTFTSFFNDYREILGVQLLDTLIPGFKYHVSMRVSRGNWTNDGVCILATDKLGLRFSRNDFVPSNPVPIDNYAQLYTDTLITDTVNWVLLEWEYNPDSEGEGLQKISLYDVLGNLCFYQNLSPSSKIKINLAGFKKGIYFLLLRNKTENIQKKVIIE